jgi:putative endonuclease
MVSFRHCEEPLRRSNDGSHVVIASEAKQPRGHASNRLDGFVSIAVTLRFASRDSSNGRGAMRQERAPAVYILASQRNGTVDTGVTSDLLKRVSEHRAASKPGFATKYAVNRSVYFEVFENMVSVIAREKQIKGGSRVEEAEIDRRIESAMARSL